MSTTSPDRGPAKGPESSAPPTESQELENLSLLRPEPSADPSQFPDRGPAGEARPTTSGAPPLEGRLA